MENKEHRRADTELPRVYTSNSVKNLPFNRLLQLYPSALYCDRVALCESSTGLIGPGHYNYQSSTLGGPSFVFSSVRRFPPSHSLVQTPIYTQTTNFTQKNLCLKEHLPQNKQDLLKIKAKNCEFKHQKVSLNRKDIRNREKKEKLKKIKDKHLKFQMKIQSTEIKVVAIGWLAMLLITTTVKSCKTLINNKKNLNERSEKILKKLLLFSKFFGKCKRSVRKYREIKAKAQLNIFARKVKQWVKKRHLKYREVVLNVIISAAATDKVFRLMYEWKNSLIFIQRMMRKLMIEKKICMALRMMQWNKLEKSLFENSKKSLKSGFSSKYQSFVPSNIKTSMMRQLLKKRVGIYIADCKAYKAKKDEILRINLQNQKKYILVKQDFIELELPVKPKPNYDFSRKDFIRMIKLATLARKNSNAFNRKITLRKNNP